MYFANPIGLLGLLALPAIVLIHMYHRRFPPLQIAGLHLWSSETRQNLAGRTRERLPLTRSLFLELLAALLLSLLLSEPHFGDLGHAPHVVVVLDNSASMLAKPPGEPQSFRDAAADELERRLADLPRHTVVTLILTGTRPVMLAGPAVPWTEARPKLADWQPNAPRHAFEPAWDLGLQLIEQSGSLLFLTDRLPEERTAAAPVKTAETAETATKGAAEPKSEADGTAGGEAPSLAGKLTNSLSELLTPEPAALHRLSPERMEVVSFGQQLNNVAIGAARWTFDAAAGQGQVFVRLQNYGDRAITGIVAGRSGEKTVFRRSIEIAAQGGAAFEAEVPGGLQTLRIDLDVADDGLSLDNHVVLVEPKVRTVTIANTLPPGPPAQLASRVLRALPDVQFGDAATAHLLVGPAGTLPPSDARLWWLGIGPVSTAENDRQQARDLAGPYVLEKQHRLLDGLSLGGVIWGGVQPVALDITPLISAGRWPLLAALNGTRSTAFLLNVDLNRSNLGDSPDWPILLSNLVELRREELPGLQRWNYRIGEDIRFRHSQGGGTSLTDPASTSSTDALTLVQPDGKTRAVARTATVELPLLEQVGIYEIRDGQQLYDQLAINFFDAEESNLRRLFPGQLPAKVANATPLIAVDNPYSWAVLIGLLLIVLTLFGDWHSLRSPTNAMNEKRT